MCDVKMKYLRKTKVQVFPEQMNVWCIRMNERTNMRKNEWVNKWMNKQMQRLMID